MDSDARMAEDDREIYIYKQWYDQDYERFEFPPKTQLMEEKLSLHKLCLSDWNEARRNSQDHRAAWVPGWPSSLQFSYQACHSISSGAKCIYFYPEAFTLDIQLSSPVKHSQKEPMDGDLNPESYKKYIKLRQRQRPGHSWAILNWPHKTSSVSRVMASPMRETSSSDRFYRLAEASALPGGSRLCQKIVPTMEL